MHNELLNFHKYLNTLTQVLAKRKGWLREFCGWADRTSHWLGGPNFHIGCADGSWLVAVRTVLPL